MVTIHLYYNFSKIIIYMYYNFSSRPSAEIFLYYNFLNYNSGRYTNEPKKLQLDVIFLVNLLLWLFPECSLCFCGRVGIVPGLQKNWQKKIYIF